jgi:hypothetical protein
VDAPPLQPPPPCLGDHLEVVVEWAELRALSRHEVFREVIRIDEEVLAQRRDNLVVVLLL